MFHRRISLLILFVALTTSILVGGCGKSVAGTYDVDKEAIKAAAQAEMKKQQENPDNPMNAMGASMVAGMIDSMTFTLTLNEDGTASMLTNVMGQSSTASGTYEVSGSRITITMAEPGKDAQSISGTVDGDTITLNPPPGEDMPFDLVFKRKAST